MSAGSQQRKKRGLPKHLFIWLLLGAQWLPLYMMAQISFKSNAMLHRHLWLPAIPTQWHWANWAFACRLVLPYIGNTIIVAAAGTALSLCFSLMAAYFFARCKMPLSGVLWPLFLVLIPIPAVLNIVPLYSLFARMHLIDSLWAPIFAGVAGTQLVNIFVLRRVIGDMPKDVFDAAELDGASHFQQVIKIVVPLGAPVLGALGVLTFFAMWNDFLLPLVVLRNERLFTLGVGLFHIESGEPHQWGELMAAFSLASLPLILFFLFTRKLALRGMDTLASRCSGNL